VLHALVEQVTVGLADERPRRLPQDLHDLGAVQVGPDLVQFLLLGQDSDPPFQVVVGTLEALCLGLVPRRAVGPGQHVQPGQQVARVPYITPDSRIGPLAPPVTVEPQVQRDQLGHVRDHGGGEAQRGEPLPGHGRPDHFMVVEGDLATRQRAARLGLADIVQQGGEPDHQVLVQPVRRLERGGPRQDGQRVLVDVLVPEMLVPLQPELGHLRQDQVRDPGVHQQGYAAHRPVGPGGADELGQLGADPFRRHHRQPAGHRGHRRPHLGHHGEPEFRGEPGRAEHP